MEPFGGDGPLGGVRETVRAAQRGDPAAMDELLRALAPFIGRVCGAVALDRADDAVQETLVAVLRGIGGLREPDALHGWVRRIAVREAVRAARRDDRVVVGDDLLARLAVEHVPDLDGAIDVRDVLAALTPEHRAVLVLRDLDGLGEAEVAELLSVPTGTVKSRLNRARAAARQRLTR